MTAEIVRQTDSEKMRPIFELAIRDLKNMFEGHLEPGDRDKIATSVMGAFTRLKATEIHADALRYQVVKDLSKDQAELQKYVSVSMPQFDVKKQLKK